MENKNPLVSIVIPVYNREELIIPCVQSALQQSYPNIEVIVVDNKSTDNTWAVLQNLSASNPKMHVFQNEENLGPVKNWKKGIEKAKGEFLKILWSDDLIKPGFVEKTLAEFDTNTAFVMTGIEIIDNNSNTINRSSFQEKTSITTPQYIEDIILFNKGYPVSPGCAIFRTDDLKNSLVVDIPNSDNLDFNRFGAGNDILLFLFTAVNYPEIKCVNQYLSTFRSHDSSITISSNGGLNIYYDWAKYFFIETKMLKLKNNFKSLIFLKRIKFSNYHSLYSAINSPISLKFIVNKLISKIIK